MNFVRRLLHEKNAVLNVHFLKSRKDVNGFPAGIANYGWYRPCRVKLSAAAPSSRLCPIYQRTLTLGIDRLGSLAWPMKAELIELPALGAWEHLALHNFESCVAPISKLRLVMSLTFGRG
jgi:hypothetical protein